MKSNKSSQKEMEESEKLLSLWKMKTKENVNNENEEPTAQYSKLVTHESTTLLTHPTKCTYNLCQI